MFLILLAFAVPAPVFGVDFAAMEAMVGSLSEGPSKELPASGRCDNAIAERLGRQLPEDFDFCQSDRQLNLTRQGLYMTLEGTVKPLPTPERGVTPSSTVIVPLPAEEDVGVEVQGAFVIDMTSPASNKSSEVSLQPKTASGGIHLQKPPTAPPGRPPTVRPVLGCPDVQTFAHRGSPAKPENSIESVVHALESGHNGVEIDVLPLRDGRWVVHHDLTTGRVSYGQRGQVANMTSHQWQQIRLKDRRGSQTEIAAPFLDDLLSSFKEHAGTSQLLNIEIKGGLQPYGCNTLAALDQRVRKQLSPFQFKYSSRSLQDLTCLRVANPGVYLGLVVDPHPESIDTEGSSNTARVMNWYDKRSGRPASKDIYVEKSNRGYLTRTSFADLESLIGPFYGFHIDYRDYSAFASVYANARGRLVLYELDEGKLAVLLADIRKQRGKLPDGVLVDADRGSYCAIEKRS